MTTEERGTEDATCLVTPDILARLHANHAARDQDHVPVVKFFNPIGEGMWLAVSIAEDGDALFGAADLGFGCPELGYFSLCELSSLRLPLGLGIERDLWFETSTPLSAWLDIATDSASLRKAEQIIGRFEIGTAGK